MTLQKFTEDRIPVDGEMKQVLLCYMLPQQKKTQEFVLRRSVIESVDIKLMQKEEHHRGSRLSGKFQFSSGLYFRWIDVPVESRGSVNRGFQSIDRFNKSRVAVYQKVDLSIIFVNQEFRYIEGAVYQEIRYIDDSDRPRFSVN